MKKNTRKILKYTGAGLVIVSLPSIGLYQISQLNWKSSLNDFANITESTISLASVFGCPVNTSSTDLSVQHSGTGGSSWTYTPSELYVNNYEYIQKSLRSMINELCLKVTGKNFVFNDVTISDVPSSVSVDINANKWGWTQPGVQRNCIYLSVNQKSAGAHYGLSTVVLYYTILPEPSATNDLSTVFASSDYDLSAYLKSPANLTTNSWGVAADSKGYHKNTVLAALKQIITDLNINELDVYLKGETTANVGNSTYLSVADWDATKNGYIISISPKQGSKYYKGSKNLTIETDRFTFDANSRISDFTTVAGTDASIGYKGESETGKNDGDKFSASFSYIEPKTGSTSGTTVPLTGRVVEANSEGKVAKVKWDDSAISAAAGKRFIASTAHISPMMTFSNYSSTTSTISSINPVTVCNTNLTYTYDNKTITTTGPKINILSINSSKISSFQWAAGERSLVFPTPETSKSYSNIMLTVTDGFTGTGGGTNPTITVGGNNETIGEINVYDIVPISSGNEGSNYTAGDILSVTLEDISSSSTNTQSLLETLYLKVDEVGNDGKVKKISFCDYIPSDATSGANEYQHAYGSKSNSTYTTGGTDYKATIENVKVANTTTTPSGLKLTINTKKQATVTNNTAQLTINNSWFNETTMNFDRVPEEYTIRNTYFTKENFSGYVDDTDANNTCDWAGKEKALENMVKRLKISQRSAVDETNMGTFTVEYDKGDEYVWNSIKYSAEGTEDNNWTHTTKPITLYYNVDTRKHTLSAQIAQLTENGANLGAYITRNGTSNGWTLVDSVYKFTDSLTLADLQLIFDELFSKLSTPTSCPISWNDLDISWSTPTGSDTYQTQTATLKVKTNSEFYKRNPSSSTDQNVTISYAIKNDV